MPSEIYLRVTQKTPSYTYQEALEASQEYFGDSYPAQVFVDKYAMRDPFAGDRQFAELTPNDMHDRLSVELARVDCQFEYGKEITMMVLKDEYDHAIGGAADILSYFEARFEIWRDALNRFARIVPQGSPMFGMGNRFTLSSLSNCVVVESPEDDITSIFGHRSADLANLFKRRCGVGIDISTLRPYLMPVNNSAITSTGAFSFGDHFSHVTRSIGQNGRRGALMLTIGIKHPDADRFATMKQDETKVTGANISLRLDDEFMMAVENDEIYTQCWPCDLDTEEYLQNTPGVWEEDPEVYGPWINREKEEERVLYAIKSEIFRPNINPRKNRVLLRRVRARDLWHLICDTARRTAEPGLIFWDNYTRNLPADYYPGFKSVSTNPCSEILLSPYDSCRLLSINLTGFVKVAFEEGFENFDFALFDHYVRLAQRAMDNIVELEIEALLAIQEISGTQEEKNLWGKLADAAIRGRRTGLGVHALGETLIRLCKKYDTDEGVAMADAIYNTYMTAAYDESVNLAIERGAFPAWDWKIDQQCPFIQRLPLELQLRMATHGRRNISLLTNAPTGSVSTLCRTSSGIEPIFRYAYIRRKKLNPSDTNQSVHFIDKTGDRWQEFSIFEKVLEDYMDVRPDVKAKWEEILLEYKPTNIDDKKEVLKADEARLKALMSILPDYFVASDTIDPLMRVRLQGAIQQYVDHGISSTINLPKDTETEVIQGVYQASWKAGLKGVTVYVDGSRSGVLVTSESSSKGNPMEIAEHHAPRRPDMLPCNIHYSAIGNKKWIIFVSLLNGRPYEIFGGEINENLKFPRKFTDGFIFKRKCGVPNAKGRLTCYDLVLGDIGGETEGEPITVPDIAVTFNDGDHALLTRMLSMSLRHGVPLPFIIEQLGRDRDSSIVSFGKVMARVLRQYVIDPETGEPMDPFKYCKTGTCE